MIDYTLILLKHYPNNLWGGSCKTYDTINWKDLTVPKPTQIELDNLWPSIELDFAKSTKITEFSLIAKKLIESGFSSSASGSLRYYDSGTIDQLNLIGAVAAGSDVYFSSRASVSTSYKEYLLHTHTQLLTVINDGAVFKANILMKFNIYKTDILNCTDLAQVALITWV